MPTYAYTCPKCSDHFDRVLSLSERDQPQTCACGEVAHKSISGGPSFVMKGDGWTGKNIKIQGQMANKNRRLSGKSRDQPNQHLVPNVGGEEVDTWSEAKQLAASKGKDTTGYDSMIRKEKAV